MQPVVGRIKSLQEKLIGVQLKNGRCIYISNLGYNLGEAKVGDLIVALYKDDKLVRRPLIQPFMTRETIKDVLYRHTRKAEPILEELLKSFDENELLKDINELSYLQSIGKSPDISHLVSGDLTQNAVKRFLYSWYEECSVRRLLLLGLSREEIKRIKLIPEKIYEQCSMDPYKLLPIPLSKCAEIVGMFQLQGLEKEKIVGQIARVVYNNLKQHCHSSTPITWMDKVHPDWREYKEELTQQYGLVEELSSLYLPKAYSVEKEITSLLHRIQTAPRKEALDITFIDPQPNEEQRASVIMALNTPVSIITGGAGTGKTTVISQIVYNLQCLKREFILCSFTGKAVARLREVTKKDAYTIHSLIHNTQLVNRKKTYVVIVDECSMVRTPLLLRLLNTLKVSSLTLVGDRNQLLPIGWGAFMTELIKSKKVLMRILEHNHRNTDGIVKNTLSILSGDRLREFDNFKLIEGGEEVITNIIQECKSKGYAKEKIKIISPYNACLASLNKIVQEIYKEHDSLYDVGNGEKWRLEDSVMFKKNNAGMGIFNGDEGTVKSVHAGYTEVVHPRRGTIQAHTKGRSKRDQEDDDDEFYYVSNLTLSYALTVDKSQGSEWEYVIFYVPMNTEPSSFLNVNRLYTALSRTKTFCWCVGNLACMNIAISQNPCYRHDNLHKRL